LWQGKSVLQHFSTGILFGTKQKRTPGHLFTKLNIDDNPATAPKYGIRGIPTLLLFKDGQVAATKVGALSKTQLKEFLDANL
ncbi:thioredoxin domain-containing protein, partial [Enterobacter ludwigii]|uniref:thioredoxin domain-containing protein n=1 Tax=Enterobacter ludwigii TaxID=299767 RepID=UPI001E404233